MVSSQTFLRDKTVEANEYVRKYRSLKYPVAVAVKHGLVVLCSLVMLNLRDETW